jgi:EmrB/QacA subfamily drug resistance transporter
MLVPLIVACALFMENLDSSIVSTSLPAIATDLGVDPVSLKLAFTSYIISIAVFTPASGWAADRFGARTVFRGAIVVFTAGSVLCALASSLEGFVGARIVQGLGGAMMVPVGRLILLKSVEKRDYLRALSWLTVPALIGPVMGPPVGGFITTYFEWRWIFWINVPIGLVGLWLVGRYIADIREDEPRRLDIAGFLLLGLGLAGLVFGVSASGIGLLPGPLLAVLVATGVAALTAYVVHARRTASPVVDLAVLKVRTYRTAIVGGSLFRIGVGGTPFLLPLLFQVGFGMSAFQSGMLTFTSAVGAISMKFTAPAILRRFGFRAVLGVNTALCAASIAASAAFAPTTPPLVIASILLVGGFFRSLQFTALNALAFSDLESRAMGGATSLSSVAQQASIAIGVSVAAGLLEVSRAIRGDAQLAGGDFGPAFIGAAVIALASVPLLLRLPPNAGSSVSGHGEPEPGDRP